MTVGVYPGWGYWPGYWAGVGWPGYWGATYWGPGYWGPGYVLPPSVIGYGAPAVVAQSPPLEYVERDPPAEPIWWYWCNDARAYYPYVKECPGGWQRVAPQSVVPADARPGEAK